MKIGAQLFQMFFLITMSFTVCPSRCGCFSKLTLPPTVEISTLHFYLCHLMLLCRQRCTDGVRLIENNLVFSSLKAYYVLLLYYQSITETICDLPSRKLVSEYIERNSECYLMDLWMYRVRWKPSEVAGFTKWHQLKYSSTSVPVLFQYFICTVLQMDLRYCAFILLIYSYKK